MAGPVVCSGNCKWRHLLIANWAIDSHNGELIQISPEQVSTVSWGENYTLKNQPAGKKNELTGQDSSHCDHF